MKEELITKAYEVAKERYAALGVDVEKVMEQLQKVAISMHCWQADDVIGFESGGSLTGGIQTTGNYPGKARNMEELRNDILKAAPYIPGKHRLNLHEIYGDFDGAFVDRDQVEVKHFESWMQWAAENGMKLDFNSTSFSHPKSGNLSLSNPDKGIRDFWIEHTKRCRAIAEEMGRRQGDPCIMNLWVHDGSKDVTVNRMKYRELFKDSLDRIFATEYKNMKDCLESKVFGIGLESYTVGSNEFCVGYSVQHQKLITIDTGHFHPTESAADKVSSMLLFVPELMLHVSRPIRWDSDHVTIMDDPTLNSSKRLFVAMLWIAYILVSTISMLPLIVLALMSSVLVLRKSVCCVRCWSHWPNFVSMKPPVRASSAWLCWKRQRPCLGMLFGICSA